MTYGWLRADEDAHQRSGFFVDEDDRILYWPTTWGLGYVLDFETADKVLSDSFAYGKVAIYTVSLGLVLLLIFPFIADTFHPYVSNHFKQENFSVTATVNLLIVEAGLFLLFFRFQHHLMVPGLYALLSKCQVVNAPHPKPVTCPHELVTHGESSCA